MSIYILSAIIITLLGFIFLFFLYTLPTKSTAKVKIIIYATDCDETEKAILSTYHFCSEYFKNAEIYICGEDMAYLDVLTRAYRFLKRDDTLERSTG